MKRYKYSLLRALASISMAAAQLPYIPTQLILSPDGNTVYEFSPRTPQEVWVEHDVSSTASDAGNTVSLQSVPIGSNGSTAYSIISDAAGISVLAGNCQATGTSTQLWRLGLNTTKHTGQWTQQKLSASDSTLRANFLSAGFSFSASDATDDVGLYIFGGMCPTSTSDASSWTSNANYSNTMLTIMPDASQSYMATGKLSPPIAEAGLSITSLEPIVSNSSSGKISQTQNVVLLGGHTSNAFINMSQVAVYSLPGGSWTFKGVNQPQNVQGELVKRDAAIVEPRSGHTAVLSADKTQIIVLGGWVGDVTNPANPQLAILELGDEYGTSNTWSWKIPSQNGCPFNTTAGIYGHGAVVLPGNVMMVSGGISSTSSITTRASQAYYYYNITSSSWIPTYQNPNSIAAAKAKSHASKTGLGAGLGIGLTAAIVFAVIAYLYARRKKQQRLEREKRLRAMALGSGRYNSESQLSGVVGNLGKRSASWGNAQEQQIENHGRSLPWLPGTTQVYPDQREQMSEVERTGLDLNAPSPTRGLRRSLHSRGPAGYGGHFRPTPTGPGSVFRIDEEEEERSIRSLRPHTAASIRSDPFKDPPEVDVVSYAAEERKKEVKGWVEDWQSAAISLSRTPSQARTYSNLSQAYSNSHSDNSPDKSDRTNSNLSERSTLSNKSVQNASVVSRAISQRSVSAGYTLFAGAAAAMRGLASGNKQGLDRSASKRSISMNDSSRYGRSIQSDGQALLREESPNKSEHSMFYTPPESPIKDYKNYSRPTHLSNRTRARGVLGSMKRVFTGTSQVDVDARVEHYEEKEQGALEDRSELIPVSEHGPTIPFWQGMKGAKDWEPETQSTQVSIVRRRSSGHGKNDASHVDLDGEDWDIETAIQQRVVQVMFTVPKEKLRVVNADALSMISRSDVGDREEDRDWDIKRMSSLREGEEPESPNKDGVRQI